MITIPVRPWVFYLLVALALWSIGNVIRIARYSSITPPREPASVTADIAGNYEVVEISNGRVDPPVFPARKLEFVLEGDRVVVREHHGARIVARHLKIGDDVWAAGPRTLLYSTRLAFLKQASRFSPDMLLRCTKGSSLSMGMVEWRLTTDGGSMD